MSVDRGGYGFAAVALTFVAGGLIGAGLGLLFAPRTGTETRERIKNRAEDTCENIKETVGTVREKAQGLAKAGKEKYYELREKVQESVERTEGKFCSKKEDDEAMKA